MRVSKTQFEYYIRKPEIAGTLIPQHFRPKMFDCQVQRYIRFGTNEIIAASIDGERFYVMAERTSGVLTEGVKRTLDYIGRFKKRTKRTPAIREIAKALKMTMGATRMSVLYLRNSGYVAKKKRVEGSIKMLPQECPVCHKKTNWPYKHKCGS